MKTDKEQKRIQERINKLRQENDHLVLHIQQLDAEKQKDVNNILLTNGRILELEEILKEE